MLEAINGTSLKQKAPANAGAFSVGDTGFEPVTPACKAGARTSWANRPKKWELALFQTASANIKIILILAQTIQTLI